MIFLNLYWPEPQPRISLELNQTLAFDVKRGRFIAQADQSLLFSLTADGLRLINAQQALPCYVNGQRLAYGEECPLQIQSTVQLARFGIVVENEESESDLMQLLGPVVGSGNDAPLPELVDLLHNSLTHVTDEPENQTQDVLKALEKEFRRALIWGTQTAAIRENVLRHQSRFTEHAFDFEQVQARVKSATVTQCIFETPALIHKVFTELKIKESDTLRAEEAEKKDILQLLAPEEVRYDHPKRIPALLVKEIYRADLDTLL
jgi:hypothetical protein